MEDAVVSGDEQEAVGVEAGGDASIAAALVDVDALAGDPGAVLGEVGGYGLQVDGGHPSQLFVERKQDSGSERLAGDELGGVGQFAAEGGGDEVELGREGSVVAVDADADDGIAKHRGPFGWHRLGSGLDEDAAALPAR